jgi:hypothetical protein
MNKSLLIISEYGNIERVRTPFTVYNINSPEHKYGKLFIVESILLEEERIYFVIDRERYEHRYFEIAISSFPT